MPISTSRSTHLKHMFYALLLPGVLAQAAPARSPDWSTEIQGAQKAQAAGNYALSYSKYQQVSKHNPLAQFVLGLFEQNGWGRKPNPVAACAWFEKSAQSHIPTGEHFWGDCLAQGIGRAVDIPAALGWYEKAATHGHFISLCSAADYYVRGNGVPQDVQKGVAMCAQAAQSNSPPAMLKLAGYYEDGGALPRNLAAARYWYQQAAERHAALAQYRLGLMLAEGKGGEPDLDGALFWLETAASEGMADAYLPTAIMYANAPVQPSTGALAPDHLAKIYLWIKAAKARDRDPARQAEIARIESMVLSVLPPTWQPDLDSKVAAHLTKYPALSQ
jgi:TPR repeat protein